LFQCNADLGPLPMNSPLRPASRVSQVSQASTYDDATTPRTRGAKIVTYFSNKIDKVARLMAGVREAGLVAWVCHWCANAAS
jgi:hypothetical protein